MKTRCPWVNAFIPRTLALLIILAQICIAAADLADVSFYSAALLAALGCAFFLFFKNRKPIEAVLVILLVPWVSRFFIAILRWLTSPLGLMGSGGFIFFDSLLLTIDRNYFVSIFPFYWLALGSFFSLSSRLFLRLEIIVANVFFLVFFSIIPASSMEVYRWPVLMIVLFGLVFFLQILSFILSLPSELRVRKYEKTAAALTALLLVAIGSVLFLRPSQERAINRGGGLLEPRLFQFDFSQFLKLETEISVNDDLVLIVKKEYPDYNILLRRYTLSGYSPGSGFFRHEAMDEKAHPQKLPDRHTKFDTGQDRLLAREIFQEYYHVNFDTSAFIGINSLLEVTPYETWDASSFNSVYRVLSQVTDAYFLEFFDAVGSVFSAEILGLSEEEYQFYTDYGYDEDYTRLAREVSVGSIYYWEKIQDIYEWLKYGEFRYSLKPGIAPSGDQLKYFLFDAKKGYCSYFAFAFTLMLRSIGIPCRVAAGFFIDNDTSYFDYYPVRANMAHAWTEVWYPGYGWIEYDPTTDIIAQGEELFFGQDSRPEIFEGLLREILDNHSRLRPKEGSNDSQDNYFQELRQVTVRILRNYGLLLLAFVIITLFFIIRFGFLWLSIIAKKPKSKARFLWAHCIRRLRFHGIKKNKNLELKFLEQKKLGESEWALALNKNIEGIYALYMDSAAACFAPSFTEQDLQKMKDNYYTFNSALRAKGAFKNLFKIRKSNTLLLILLSFYLFSPVKAQDIQSADELFNMAMMAEAAENWERAVELLSLGSSMYPDDFNFPWALGNLFYNRRLFHQAWNEYRRSERISSTHPDLLYQLARTAALLNLNEESVIYYERFLLFYPDDREAISSLGWMYYKIHRPQDGERLLLGAIDRIGIDADFAMTLGTIYSAMFNYEEAKKWYLESISRAELLGSWLFVAVARYNLSILESRFYQYDLAYRQTNLSLNAANRASGRLARGELYSKRMELGRSFQEFQTAYDMDTSPLSKLSLAEIFLYGGRLEEARLYAEDCLNLGDLSWMVNFGIDPVRYQMEIHDILRKTYKGLENSGRFYLPLNFRNRFFNTFRLINYRFKAAVHGHLYRKYALHSAQAYDFNNFNEIHLDTLEYFYKAFEPYPHRAINYLGQARDFELPLIPESVSSYDFEEGRLFRNHSLLLNALEAFDSEWQKDKIAFAYIELAGISRYSRNAAEELYAINPGALLQHNITLEVNLNTEFPGSRRLLNRAVTRAGFRIAPAARNMRYSLTVSLFEDQMVFGLFDTGTKLKEGSFNGMINNNADAAALSIVLKDLFFSGF